MDMDRPWFTDKAFSSLEIRKDKSLADHTVVRSVTITDTDYIQQLAARIEQIPPNGDMMISFSGEAEIITLSFFAVDTVCEIDIIQRGFKTPSTGFNIKNDHERELYAEIDALLYPAIDKIIPTVAGLALVFDDFSLCYNGTRFEDHAPVSLSFHIAEFIFTDKNGDAQAIKISAGQLPPQPYVVSNKGISILTFRSKDEKRLYPGFFQVVKGVLVMLLSFVIAFAYAQPPLLEKEIRHADSVFFDAFNHCDTVTYRQLLTNDFEFYHDLGGLHYLDEEMQSMREMCARNSHIRRQLDASSLEVHKLGATGALEIGVHSFYHTNPGQTEHLSGTYKFIQVWKKDGGMWKLSRVISYDHGKMNNN